MNNLVKAPVHKVICTWIESGNYTTHATQAQLCLRLALGFGLVWLGWIIIWVWLGRVGLGHIGFGEWPRLGISFGWSINFTRNLTQRLIWGKAELVVYILLFPFNFGWKSLCIIENIFLRLLVPLNFNLNQVCVCKIVDSSISLHTLLFSVWA